MPRYVFKDGPVRLTKAKEADAQALGEAIEGPSRAIERKLKTGAKLDEADALKRMIHAEVVRDGAKHPFHKHLEWNDKRGAYLHRLDQIGAIIRIIRVVDEATDEPVPAFISVKSANDERAAYRPVAAVVNNLDLQIATLRRAEGDLQAFRRRYQVLADICEGASQLEQRVREKRERLMKERPSMEAAA
jgi:hypothetical protein